MAGLTASDGEDGAPGSSGEPGAPGKDGNAGPPGKDAEISAELIKQIVAAVVAQIPEPTVDIDAIADSVIKKIPPIYPVLTWPDGTVRRNQPVYPGGELPLRAIDPRKIRK